MAKHKLDPAPLVDATDMGVRPLSRRLGVDPAVLCRPISFAQADRFAVALGFHPADVWGDEWWAGEDD